MGVAAAIGGASLVGGMLGGKGGDDSGAVTAPDPRLMAELEAQYNRGNIVTPFGSLYRFGDKRENTRIELSAEQQAAVNRALANANSLQQPQSGDQAATAAFQAMMGRISPDFDRRRRILQAQADASGNPAVGVDLAPGAVSELDILERARNDALTQAAGQAAQIGQQQRLADLQVNAGFQQLLNNNATLFGGGSLFPIQQAPVDIMGAYQMMQNSQLANARIAQDDRASKNSTIGQLAGAAATAYGGK